MNSKRSFWSIFFVLAAGFLTFSPSPLWAVPANPAAGEAIQPDGRKITFFLRGDEYFSWHEDEQGYVIQQDAGDGFWKYAVPKTDRAGFDLIDEAIVGIADPAALPLKKHELPAGELLREFRRAGPFGVKTPAAEPTAVPGDRGDVTLETPPPLPIPVSGTKTVKNIVILAGFNDHWDTANGTVLGAKGRVNQTEYVNLFNQIGHVSDGAVGSVKDYYREVSYSKLTVDSVVTVWVKLPQNEAVYDADTRLMVTDAISAADAAGFNFAQGDSDGDGWVDSLTIIHSGHGQEVSGNPATSIWSHMWSLASVVTIDGVKISRYHTEPALRGLTSSSAISRVGVICHEMGHFFGLPDLYDYSSLTLGIGYWGLMAGGSWNGSDGKSPAHLSAWSKYMLGFVKPTIIHSESSLSLPRVEDNAVVHLYIDGMANGEYFLVENRARTGFDNTVEIFPGILVYHVDSKSANNDLGTWPHPVVKIEEADGNNSIGAKTAGSQAGDVWTSTSGLAGGFRDQTGDQDANAMLYQAAHAYNRTDSAASYTYLRLGAFSAAGSTMTYSASTLKPTVAAGTSGTGNYTVSWGASSNATKYEIQEGTPVVLTSLADGAESERALYENWAIQGDVQRSSGGFRTGASSYVFQAYDAVAGRWHAAVQGLTSRAPFTVKNTTTISFYYKSKFDAASGYLKYQVSKDGGNTWLTLGTQGGYQDTWTHITYGYASLNALGVNLNDQCLFRFIANFEQGSGWSTWPSYGYAIDDFQIANTEIASYGNWTTLSSAVATNTYAVSGKGNGTCAYQVQAYANGLWQGYGSPGAVTVSLLGPTVTSATSSSANGYYKAAAAINVTVNFSAAATSTGGLTINLNSGASLATGPFSGVTSVSRTYTVGAGQTTADLSISSITGTIVDAGSYATVNPTVPAGQNIADAKAIVIDTTAPTIAIGAPAVSLTKAGPVLFTVTYADTNFNTITLAAGDVTINKTGTANGTVVVMTGTGLTRRVYLDALTGDGLLGISLAAGTAADLAGNGAPAAGPSATFRLDGTPPTITGATSTTTSGQYKAGAAINVTVNFSEAVSAAGLTINLNSGGTVTTGALGAVTSFSGTYTVGAGQTAADLSITSITGTLTDEATNSTLNPTVPAGLNIGDSKAIVIDTTAPTIAIGAPSAPLTRAATVSFPVTYTDTNFSVSTLAIGNVTLNKTGTANGTVTVTGAGSTRTVFISGPSGDGTLGISLAAGTGTDVAGNSAPGAGPSATFAVDTSAPQVSSANSATANGHYRAGDAVDVTVNFSEKVSSSGLTINLDSGGTVSTGTLSGVTSSSGTYTVGAGQTSADLSIASIWGTLTDAAGNAVTAPAVPAGGNISDAKNIVIDTTAPAVAIGAPSASTTGVGPVSFAVTYTDTNFSASSLTVGNVTLNKTGTADATVAVSGSGATRTVTLSSCTGDGTLGIALAGGTAADLAGNRAPASGPSATFVVENTVPPPTVTVQFSLATATFFEAATPATISVTLSEAAGQTVAVSYATANGTASAGSDYTATSGTLIFPPGVTGQTITVPIINDAADEPLESFTVTLSAPLGVGLGATSVTTCWIDDDFVPGLSGLNAIARAVDQEAWTFTGTAGAGWWWQAALTHDGADAARSGFITDSQSSSFQTIGSFVEGSVSFWWKVSSEAAHDYLRFSIDGAVQGAIAGEVDWEYKTYPVSAGSHTLKWEYAKDGSGAGGTDAAWVDQVVLPAAQVLWARGASGEATLAPVEPGTPSVASPANDGTFLTVPSGDAGPWEATSFARVDASTTAVLWSRSDTGQAILAQLATGALSGNNLAVTWAYLATPAGIAGSWLATSYAPQDASTGYVLWSRGDTGEAILAQVDPGGAGTIPVTSWAYLNTPDGVGGPWQATSYTHVDAASGYVLWSRGDTGQAILWKVVPGEVSGTIPVASWAYLHTPAGVGGPWRATSYTPIDASEGYVLWTRGDTGEAILWRVVPGDISGTIPVASWGKVAAPIGADGTWRATGYAPGATPR